MADAQFGNYVLNYSAVRRAIEILSSRRSHEHLPGYLALLRARLSGDVVGVREIEEFYNEYLRVPAAPADSPYLRPFLSRGYGSLPSGYGPLRARGFLMNKNLQGSYARSSMRQRGFFSQVIRIVEHAGHGTAPSEFEYVLVDGHEEIVLSKMLVGHRVPALSLAIFLFRERVLQLKEARILGLVGVLRSFLQIETEVPDGDRIYGTLFDSSDDSEYDDIALLKSNEVGSLSLLDDPAAMVSERSVRSVTLENIGLDKPLSDGPSNASELDDWDPILASVRVALELGYAGVILAGPPGTGKSWYAQQIAVAITGRWENVRSVQFHPSYQYEDFVFGYVPTEQGVFRLQAKEFVRVCRDAGADPAGQYVLIIDEISRSDVVRVFGEALTYVETDKRDQPFVLACGEELAVPKNLVFVCTMNSRDKGVDEVDMAFERRFAEVTLAPDAGVLRRLLERRFENIDRDYLGRLIGFFEELQREAVAEARLGHAYFLRCGDVHAAMYVWSLRVRPTLEKALVFDRASFERIEKRWENVVGPDGQDVGSAVSETEDEQPNVGED